MWRQSNDNDEVSAGRIYYKSHISHEELYAKEENSDKWRNFLVCCRRFSFTQVFGRARKSMKPRSIVSA